MPESCTADRVVTDSCQGLHRQELPEPRRLRGSHAHLHHRRPDGALMNVSYKVNAPMLSTFGLIRRRSRSTARSRKAASPCRTRHGDGTHGLHGHDLHGPGQGRRAQPAHKIYGVAMRRRSLTTRMSAWRWVPFSGAVRLNTSAYDFDLKWIDTPVRPLCRTQLHQHELA